MSTVTKKAPSTQVRNWLQEALLAIGRVPKPNEGQLAQLKTEAEQQAKDLEEVRKKADRKVKDLRIMAADAENRRQQVAIVQDQNKPMGKDGQELQKKEYQKAVDRVSEAEAKVNEAKAEVSRLDKKIEAANARAKKAEESLKSEGEVDIDDDPDMAHAFKVVLAHQMIADREGDLNESLDRYNEAEKQHKKLLPRKKSKDDDDPEIDDPEFDKARRDFLDAIAAHDAAKLAAKILESDDDDTAIPEELDVLREKAGKKAEKGKQSVETAKNVTNLAREGRDNKKSALDLAARQDPTLAVVAKNLDEARENLEEKQKDLVAADEALDTHLKNLDRYRDALSRAAGEKKLPFLQLIREASKEIATARGQVETSKRAANTAKQLADQAAKRYEEAFGKHVEENPNSPVAVHAKLVSDAEGQVRNAERLETEAKEDYATASGRASELDRRAKVLEELPRAKESMAQLQQMLKKHGLEDTPIWTGAVTISKSIPEKGEYDQLVKLAGQLSGHYESLQTNGATPAELEGLYKDFPEKWRPPRFREDEKNWSAVAGWFSEENAEKSSAEANKQTSNTDIAKKIAGVEKTFMETVEKGLELPGQVVGGAKSAAEGVKSAIDFAEAHGITGEILSKGKALLEQLGEKLGSAESDLKDFEKVVGPVGKFAALAAKGFQAMSAGLKTSDALGKEETEDPIEQLMREDEMLDCLKEIGKLGAGIGGQVVALAWKQIPGLDVATNTVEAQVALKNMVERLSAALEDTALREEAQEGGHRLEPALGQMANRGKHLAAREGTDAAIATLNAAAGVLNLTGVGAKVGVAMKGVATVAAVGKSAGVMIVDKSEAQTAKTLLDQAQAGNGDARRDLFRHHPRYAKGILAVMASEGDSFAIRCLSNHDLTEDMIRKSSPAIIKRYLLKRFGETDEGGTSWSETWESVKNVASYLPKGLSAFAGLFVTAHEKLVNALGSDLPSTWLATLSLTKKGLPALEDVHKSLSDLKTVRRRRDDLADTLDPDKPEEVDKLAALDKLVDETTEKVEELRKGVDSSLETMEKITMKAENLKRTKKGDADIENCLQVSLGLGGTLTELVVALAES